MTYSIKNGRLRKNGAAVDYLESKFMGGPFGNVPTLAVVHFTYGGTARSSAEWFRSKKNPGSSAHVVIERDGTVIQCVPFDRIAWHAGKSSWRGRTDLNKHSFGIELANWGYLKKAGDGWICWTGTRINEPFEAVHKNGNPDGLRVPIGWETYPEPQFAAAVEVLRALRDSHGLDEIVGHDDVSPTRKWDPGPAFDLARCRAGVFGGRAASGAVRVKVAAQSGLNLRCGAGTHFAAIELLPAGTELEPIATDGLWTEVSVLGGNGEPRATGWVHSRYLEDA